MTVRILALILLLTVTTVIGIVTQPAAAQTETPSPTATLTTYTPTANPTATNTPTPLPTLAALLPDREVITAANTSQIQKYREWQAHPGTVAGIAFIPNTTRVVTVGIEESDETAIPMRLWEIQENRITEIENFFEGIPAYQSYGMYDLSLSQDGTRIFAAGSGFRVWDAKTGKIVGQVFQNHAGIHSLGDDNQTLVTGSSYDFVALWSIPAAIPSGETEMGPLPEDFVFSPQGSLINAFHAGEQINQVAFNADTYQVFVLTQTGRLLIYQPISEIEYGPTIVPQAPLSSDPSAFPIEGGRLMDINHDRHEITYSDSNWDMVVYNFEHNEIVARYPLGKPTLCINYSPDGKLLLLTDWDFRTTLQLFDTATQEKVADIVTGSEVRSCDFSWDGTLIATGDHEGQVALWGVPS
jgi:WD40 repeat protein